MVRYRNPVFVGVLGFLTGIYQLYWLIVTTRELRKLTQSGPTPWDILGLFVLFLTAIVLSGVSLIAPLPLAIILLVFAGLLFILTALAAISFFQGLNDETTMISGGSDGLFILFIAGLFVTPVFVVAMIVAQTRLNRVARPPARLAPGEGVEIERAAVPTVFQPTPAMACRDHPGVSADFECAECHKSFCSKCMKEITGEHYCSACRKRLGVRRELDKIGGRDEMLRRIGAGYYAGLWPRFMAYLADVIILGNICVILLFIAPAVYYVALGAGISIVYCVGFWVWRGQTPGKMLFGLKVVAADGRPISLGRAILRYFGYGLSDIPPYLVSCFVPSSMVNRCAIIPRTFNISITLSICSGLQ